MAPPSIPDPLNIKVFSPKKIEVCPSGNAPPSGTIVALPRNQYPNSPQGFSINDGAAGHQFVKFSIYTTGSLPPPSSEYVIDISGVAPGDPKGAVKVGKAIADAVNQAHDEGVLFVEASADPTDGRVYLTYDFTSDLNSDGNSVVIQNQGMPPGTISPWVPGGSSNDVRNVQWAIENVATGGEVVLKRCAANTSTPLSFQFGRIGRVKVDKNVQIKGECEPEKRAGLNQTGSGRWILAGTTILGGTQMVIGGSNPVTYSLTDIIFDGFYAGAVRVMKSSGKCVISGCHFRNFVFGRVVGRNTTGAFPIVVDGGTAAKDADDCGGTLKVVNNYFGKPVAGTNPVTPTDNFNNLMHFSNCNLDLEISANEIEDCVWGGFLTFGNKGRSTITKNTINKSKSYYEGAAIAVGLMTANYDSQEVYTGESVVADNRITVTSSNSVAILIAAFPRDLRQPVTNKTPVLHHVTKNMIVVSDAKAAMACMGDCSTTKWTSNTVTGSAKVGIWITRSLPPFPIAQLPAGDTLRPSYNQFGNNDLRGLTASFAEVYVCDAHHNTFEDNDYATVGFVDMGTASRGLAGVYIRDSYENTFKDETFWGDYPGIMDSVKIPLPDPLPCMWLAAGAVNNHVKSVYHDTAKLGSDICTQVFCFVPAKNDIKGYQQCIPVPGSVVQALLDKEAVAMASAP